MSRVCIAREGIAPDGKLAPAGTELHDSTQCAEGGRDESRRLETSSPGPWRKEIIPPDADGERAVAAAPEAKP